MGQDRLALTYTPLEKDTICVPPKYLPELKKVPDDVISFTKAIDEVREVPIFHLLP